MKILKEGENMGEYSKEFVRLQHDDILTEKQVKKFMEFVKNFSKLSEEQAKFCEEQAETCIENLLKKIREVKINEENINER